MGAGIAASGRRACGASAGEIVVSARLDPARDALERRLARAALEAGKPVHGVCRGAQMLNMALGGDLHQDACRHYAASRRLRAILPRKDVEIAPDTPLARIAGAAPMRVTVSHHRLGEPPHDGEARPGAPIPPRR